MLRRVARAAMGADYPDPGAVCPPPHGRRRRRVGAGRRPAAQRHAHMNVTPSGGGGGHGLRGSRRAESEAGAAGGSAPGPAEPVAADGRPARRVSFAPAVGHDGGDVVLDVRHGGAPVRCGRATGCCRDHSGPWAPGTHISIVAAHVSMCTAHLAVGRAPPCRVRRDHAPCSTCCFNPEMNWAQAGVMTGMMGFVGSKPSCVNDRRVPSTSSGCSTRHRIVVSAHQGG
jgi:hypothetical protein